MVEASRVMGVPTPAAIPNKIYGLQYTCGRSKNRTQVWACVKSSLFGLKSLSHRHKRRRAGWRFWIPLAKIKLPWRLFLQLRSPFLYSFLVIFMETQLHLMQGLSNRLKGKSDETERACAKDRSWGWWNPSRAHMCALRTRLCWRKPFQHIQKERLIKNYILFCELK